jgi:iron uptake system EfeUOB component EfeO/EfeM
VAATLGTAACSARPGPSAPSGPPAASASATGPVADLVDPVTVFELAEPLSRYQDHVAAQLALLARQTETLRAELVAGDMDGAKAAWLAAHLTYHRVGAAYGAFGDAGEAIDGLATGLPRGVDDPGFRGFHRIEHLLWSGAGPRAAVAPAEALAAQVRALRAEPGALDIATNDFSLRAHEILEDTLQVQLNGGDDYGSHSELATAAADVEGTRTITDLLRPVLERRSPGLPARIDRDLAALGAVLPRPGAPVPSLDALPRDRRQRIDAATGRALETLALVPGLLEVREED